MAIDATNLLAVRLEYGDVSETVFSDPEISTIWDFMSNAASDYEQRRATIGQMFVITRNNAIKLHDYTQGESQEKKDQIFKHLQQVVAEYQQSIDDALGTKAEIARSTLRPRPHQTREYPVIDERYRFRTDRILKDSTE